MGTVTITATVEARVGTAELTLAPIVSVGRRHPSTFRGDTTLLVAFLTDARGTPLAGESPLWTSLAPDVATVAPDGVVTGVAPGYATIVATAGGGSGMVEVAVLLQRIGVTREVSFLKEVQRSDGLNVPELWVMQPDGSMPMRVSRAEELVNEYAWAPDGGRIAVNYLPLNGIGRSGLYVLTADGTQETFLSTGAVYPRWSPDGTRIAYRTYEGDIYSIRPDGTDLRPLATLAGDELNPEWSPDGRQIAYWRAAANTYELWLMDADGGAKRHFPLPFPLNGVRWSPDGKYLAVENQTTGLPQHHGIWLIHAAGTGLRALSPNCTSDGTCAGPEYSEAEWSPDGKQVAFTIRNIEGTTTNIGVINPGGTGFIVFPNGDGCCVDTAATPHWSPDAAHLAFQTRIPVGNGYYRAIGKSLSNGSGAVILTGPYSASGPGWRP
jgi:TolB protein